MIALVAWYGTTRNAAAVTVGTPVLLGDVENLTGDSSLDRPLFLAASVGLQQSRQVSLFPRSRVRETLALMQRPGADSMLNEALAREVAIRENLSRVVLLGISRVDTMYLVTARILDPASGRDVFADRERAATAGAIIESLDRLLSRVRRATGEPVDSVRAYSVPLPRVTTASLDALRAYAAGQAAWSARRYDEAKTHFGRAVALDSTFALAWLGLADLYYQLWNDRLAGDTALSQALRFADRLTERERLLLEKSSMGYRGLVDEQLQIAEQLARRFPERDTWHGVGTFLMRFRRCPEAITALERSLAFDSTFANAHINIATCHQFLGQSDSAVVAYNRAYAVDSNSVYTGALNHEFGVALVRAGRIDSASNVYARMARRGTALDRQYGQRSLAYVAAWMGRSRQADAHFDSAAVLAAEGQYRLSAFRNRVLQAQHRLTVGTKSSALSTLDAAARLSKQLTLDPAFALYAGLANVRAGQLTHASALLQRIATTSRGGSANDRTIHSVLAAQIALARGNAQQARRALEAATDTTRSDYTLPALVDVHIALGHADSALEASTRFAQRVVFGIDAQDAWQRNLLILGRLSEQLGRLEDARAAYARLETQLSAGDIDHPLRLEARRGMARIVSRDARRTPLPIPPRPSR